MPKGLGSRLSNSGPPDGLKNLLSSRLASYAPPFGPPGMFSSGSDLLSPPDGMADSPPSNDPGNSSPSNGSNGSKGKSGSKCDPLGPEAQKAIPSGLDSFFPPGAERYIPFAILHGQGPPLPESLVNSLRSKASSSSPAGMFATPPPPTSDAEGPPVSKGAAIAG